MRTYLLLVIICMSVLSCTKKETAQDIIGKSIQVSGGKNFDEKKITFKFRDKVYESYRKGGIFELKRITGDSVVDVLSNNGFQRIINGNEVSLADSTANKYTNSVNSVHYFAYLPYGLDGKAVHKKLMEEEKIKGTNYYKIKVWFDQEGGGEDFEDIFVYWINKESYKVDYLAYEYHVNGGGMRFREAYNRRNINGIDFVDYNNYKPKSKTTTLFQMDSLFEINSLELLSKIELENVSVENCADC